MIKILVVDDETDVRVLFEQRFRREIRKGEYSFTFAYSGEEALDFIHAHASEVVLILSDINMPGMSGLELLKRIRQEYNAPPPVPPQVMMITAYGDADSRQQALQLGANDFLTKPVDFTALKEKLHAIGIHEN
ncbi:response regulator [Microvirga sp. STR05]|uniref:Response regulator n=1 Tax=Hymenobacter duratus TaxID=2771356 RepID=A0ABR8JIV8_9BACT|nr:response regulator [Hymenobacter duratus]MBD2716812.1 response regulator [Hymenobacter duratus]MBR7951727.1 response regulator [Microvirga sp. STR05]